MARFGANLSDAHSCFIFLPNDLMASLAGSPPPADFNRTARSLTLAGYHSLSNDVIENCSLPPGDGLIGWVAKHNKAIHVSPFELDSRTLGIYASDQQLKSFIGIPISLDCGLPTNSQVTGVLASDSKKSFAFSKLQGKLLEDLAQEIANTIELLLLYGSQGQTDVAWQTFLRRSEELVAALGAGSVEILRLKLVNFAELEVLLGTSSCLALVEQIFRLLQQALPPHFPIARLLNGDIVVCLDNMVTSFYENKICALCEHIAGEGRRPKFIFSRASFRDKKYKAAGIEGLVGYTAQPTEDASRQRGGFGEIRRHA